MMQIVQWVGFGGGILLVIATYRSIIGSIIVPRQSMSAIGYRAWQFVNAIYTQIACRVKAYERQDRVLASLGPVSLLFTLGVWIVLLLLGYALLFLPFMQGNLGTAFWLSGSSLFTLGVASSAHPGPIAIEFCEAATGLIVVALLIGYLPTIYSAYNRRETLVTALSSRAGDPAWGPEILARHHLDHTLPSLGALYAAWETLAADISETHSSYPWLIIFRSPDPLHSWVTSLLAMLDAQAMHIALAPSQAPIEAGQSLRMGFLCLRKVARITGAYINHDPSPDDPLELTLEEFAQGVAHLQRVGFPMERTAAEAWSDYRGWRVNYEPAAYALAAYVFAVPAPWSGKRPNTATSVIDVLSRRPRHRTPTDPEGEAILRLEQLELESFLPPSGAPSSAGAAARASGAARQSAPRPGSPDEDR